MPEYIYHCPNCGNEITVVEPIFSNGNYECSECQAEMHRKPQAFHVNWGGLKPSQGELSPAQKWMINGAEKRREEAAKCQ